MSNREIKFRAWNGEKMITQFDGIANIDTFNTSSKKQLLVCIGGYSWGTANWGTNVIIEQYTGLKDRNGVEIYEGDIVKWGHIAGGLENPIRVARVDLFPSLTFEIIKDRKKFFKPRFAYGNFIYTNTEKWLEVIGNIHQNPELL